VTNSGVTIQGSKVQTPSCACAMAVAGSNNGSQLQRSARFIARSL
jgi:hypothetical protein